MCVCVRVCVCPCVRVPVYSCVHVFVCTVGLLQPRIHEDYFDNFPGDLNEVVDQFNTGFVDWMSSSFILSAEEVCRTVVLRKQARLLQFL